MTAPPLLEVRELVTEFASARGVVRAVDGVSFEVPRGAAVGLVGESGSGKSVTALSLLRLIQPPGRIASGSVRFDGEELLALDEKRLRALRGDRLAMIFQEPMTSLNPVYSTGDQVGEVLRVHRGLGRREARARAVELLAEVGIADAERRAAEYPHQMSGGMRQRVMIAMALACRPSLLVADEPTTALDVTVQAAILDLLAQRRRELGMAVLLITHDLGVVSEFCDEVVVMYAGQVVERATARALFASPRHPYTRGLLAAVPPLVRGAAVDERAPRGRLTEIPGMVPRLDALGPGCRFADRCPDAAERCRTDAPSLRALDEASDAIDPRRLVRCHFPVAPAHPPVAESPSP